MPMSVFAPGFVDYNRRSGNEQFMPASKSCPQTLQSRWPTADFLSIFTETECS
jgi:hypothetical protein